MWKKLVPFGAIFILGYLQIITTRLQRINLWPLELLSQPEGTLTIEDAREVILYSESGMPSVFISEHFSSKR